MERTIDSILSLVENTFYMNNNVEIIFSSWQKKTKTKKKREKKQQQEENKRFSLRMKIEGIDYFTIEYRMVEEI